MTRAGLALWMASVAGCAALPSQPGPHDPTRAEARPPLGLDLLSLRWKHVTRDRRGEIKPQEFASPVVWADTVYAGSKTGTFVALRATTGVVRWQADLGPVGGPPTVGRGYVYVGTDDGELHCLDAQTGKARWSFAPDGGGGIAQAPVLAGDLVIFSNEAGEVRALDAQTGTSRWQHVGPKPDLDATDLRGHAGVAVDGDFVYTGFSDGTLVALRRDTGTLAWSASLRGEAERFVDVDATPVLVGDRIFATSSSGGVWGLDRVTGRVHWRLPIEDASLGDAGSVGGLASDGERLFVAVAELGLYALDLDGNVLWRQGTRGGGEPGTPVVADGLLVYTLAHDGMFLADPASGELFEYFDPGDGVSAAPAIAGDALFVLTNLGVLYGFDLEPAA